MPPRSKPGPAAKAESAAPKAAPVEPAAPLTPLDPQVDPATPEPDPVAADPAPTSPTGTAAAPIAAPDEATAQRSPHLGHDHLSTNPLAANAAIHSPAGASHNRLVDDDGNDVALADIFELPTLENPVMVATVRQRVYQEFLYPNTSTPATHLLYAAGTRVPVAEAMRVLDTYKYAAEHEKP